MNILPSFRSYVIICTFIISLAAGDIAILTGGGQRPVLLDSVYNLLSRRYDVQMFTLEGSAGIHAVRRRGYDLIILADRTARDFYRQASPPAEADVSYAALGTHAFLENVLSVGWTPASNKAFAHLRELLGAPGEDVLIIADSSTYNRAVAESAFFASSAEILLYDTTETPREFARRAEKREASFYRIALSPNVAEILAENPALPGLLRRRASAVAVENRALWRPVCAKVPLITLREDSRFTATAAALLLAAYTEDFLPLKEGRAVIGNAIASLSHNKVTHFTLRGTTGRSVSRFRQHLTGDTPLQASQIRTDLSGTVHFQEPSVRSAASAKEVPVREPSVAETAPQREVFFSKDLILKHPVYTGLAAAGIALVLVLLGLVIALIRRRRKKAGERSVLMYPQDLRKQRIAGHGRRRTLEALFRKNGFTPVCPGTLLSMQKIMRKAMPDIFVLDWRKHKALDFLRSELARYALTSAEMVIIFNVPETRRREVEESFGTASTLVFSRTPDADTFIRSMNSNRSAGEDLSGRIREGALASILQVLETQQNTGCLVVEDDSPLSIFYYRDGRIVHAEDRLGNSGLEAVFTGLSCETGSFRFLSGKNAPTQSVNLGAMAILMEFSRRWDEQHHD
ncbi:MAG: DUF4388 domain-containing protein [Fibrobacterota bacterium]